MRTGILSVCFVTVAAFTTGCGLKATGRVTAQPSPAQTPAEVVSIQLEGLQHYNQPTPNAGIWTAYQFASPANRQVTGPYGRFLQIIRSRSNRALLHSREWRIDHVRPAGPQAQVVAVVSDDSGAISTWTFSLSQQESAACKGCWMTDGVQRSLVPQ
jgi:hypothetical protein